MGPAPVVGYASFPLNQVYGVDSKGPIPPPSPQHLQGQDGFSGDLACLLVSCFAYLCHTACTREGHSLAILTTPLCCCKENKWPC